jgi:hypothetical protein
MEKTCSYIAVKKVLFGAIASEKVGFIAILFITVGATTYCLLSMGRTTSLYMLGCKNFFILLDLFVVLVFSFLNCINLLFVIVFSLC